MIPMDPADSPQPAPAPSSPGGSPLARLALGLSIFAFLLPLGIAAVVLGHIAEARMDSASPANDWKTACAALWIAYIQLALVGLIAVVGWGLFHDVARGFQQDAIVERIFRGSDQLRPLDPESARDAENTARTLLDQLIAIEDEVHRKDGSYICNVNELVFNGLEGATDAEKRALAESLADSPYIYEIRDCHPIDKDLVKDSTEPCYTLIAVPRSPRMPQGSAIFCSDQTGVIHDSRGGTSLDCLKKDFSSPAQPEIPRILK